MAHFAQLDDEGTVLAVLAVSADSAPTEEEGVAFLAELTGHENWKQCSFTGRIRKNYPGPGFVYDAARDAFIPPQPFPSWALDDKTCTWAPPIPTPADPCYWDEANQKWVMMP